MAKIVLITGCSTGIGRDLAQRLTRSGYTVVATARKVESLGDLPVALKLPLDVTRRDSVDQAVEQTLQHFGGIDVLVNNAGYGLRGALEEVADEDVHAMFEVNVFGVIRMIHAIAPHMRKQKSGRIVNVGSLAGKLVVPVNGAYSATKYALEALSDALRLELASFGIQVALIEPGNIRTNFLNTALVHSDALFANSASPYQELYQHYQQATANLRRHEPGPEVVSQIIQQAIEAKKPKARYLVGVPYTTRLTLFLGDSVKDNMLKRMFRISP